MDIDINLPGITTGFCGSLKIPYSCFCIGNSDGMFGNIVILLNKNLLKIIVKIRIFFKNFRI